MTENQTHDMVKKELLQWGQTTYYIEARLGFYEEHPRHSSNQCLTEDVDGHLNTQKQHMESKQINKKSLAKKMNPKMQI